ncbi:DNA translocase FtsK [Lachnospiraceae bacterium ZAX-1]
MAKTAKNHKKNEPESAFLNEVVILCILAICILLFISNFGVGGVLGEKVSSVLFGLFGLVSYIVPICFFVGTAFFISNRRNKIATLKLVASILFIFMLCLFIELVVGNSDQYSIVEAYRYAAKNKSGGGFIGGIFTKLLCPSIGVPGTYVIDIVLLIICLVLITERSFLGGVKKGSKIVYNTAKDDAIKYREKKEHKREVRAQKRMDKKVEGVAIDTKILSPTPSTSDNINELKLPDSAPKFTKNAMEKLFSKEELPPIGEPQPEPVVIERVWQKPWHDQNQPSGQRKENIINIADKINRSAKKPENEADVAYKINEAAEISENEVDTAYKINGASEISENEADAAYKINGTAEMSENEAETAYKTKGASAENAADIRQEINGAASMELEQTIPREYLLPPISLLKKGKAAHGDTKKHLQETAAKLQQTLKSFGVSVTITDVSCGPSVTRYEMQPEQGVKVSKIVNLADDIKLNLAAPDIRIEAPISGKAAVGIEVPNKETVMVQFRDMIEAEQFQKHSSSICFTAGKDIGGKVVVADIAKMPHLLIAGATGSGKSVCINTIIMSILFKANPDDVKLILIDPKVVELSVYNGIPHLFIPVVTDPKKAAGALHWAVAEMSDRYQRFAEYQVRDLKGYNQKIEHIKDIEDETKPQKMPQIVIVVDELADLMMVAPGDVEDAICRLAQLARAAGIHLIIATQRPSVDVITGLIKANMPSRIAFSVSSGIDSRTILDMVGAEKLLGNGDMLFYPQGYQKPLRVQGPFVSDDEVEAVVDFLKKQSTVVYNAEIEEKLNKESIENSTSAGTSGNERDAYFVEAGKFVIEKDKGSIGMLQRWFKVGFNRAARIMDQLEEAGVVGPEEGTKSRKIQMSLEEFEEYVDEYV